MTSKVYRSAQGKMVDLGTIKLQNEHVRAVGNMKVNARGDKIDALNQVIETRTERIQRHNDRTSTNVTTSAPQTSSKKPRSSAPRSTARTAPETQIHSRGHVEDSTPEPVVEIEPTPAPAPVEQRQAPAPQPARRPQPVPSQSTVSEPNPVRPAKSTTTTEAPSTSSGGLASAIARSREIKQELDRTRRQQAQDRGLRKI